MAQYCMGATVACGRRQHDTQRRVRQAHPLPHRRRRRDLSLGLQPAVEHAQTPVPVGGRGGLPAGELVGDERLDVLAPRLLQLDASGSEELTGQPECVEVRLDGAAGLVLGSEVQLEGANQVSYAGVGSDRTAPRTKVESDALEALCRELVQSPEAESAGQAIDSAGM